MEQASVLLVDEHPALRQGLRELLHQTPGIRSVEEASSLGEALEAVDHAPPDLIVLDGGFLGHYPGDVTAALRDGAPSASLIVLCALKPQDDRIAWFSDGVDIGVDRHHSAQDLGLAVVLCLGLPWLRSGRALRIGVS